MEKIKSFRRGRVWLNVYADQDGELALTIRKSFLSREGGWKHTNFLRPGRQDLMNLVDLLVDFMEFKEQQKTLGWVQ